MVTKLPAHTRERIDEIRTYHRPARRKWWLRPLVGDLRVCVMCGRRWPCHDLRWADDVSAGRVAPAGFAAGIPVSRIPRQRTPDARPVRDAAWWEL